MDSGPAHDAAGNGFTEALLLRLGGWALHKGAVMPPLGPEPIESP